MKRCSVILSNGIKDFHPAYFAMVMATGIMSIAFEAMTFPGIAKALFTLNLIFYLILCTILAARTAFFRPDLMVDLRTPRRAVLFLTFVVGTNTIGMQLVTFQQATGWAIGLGLVALIGWFGCLYFIALDFIAMQGKPLHEIVNGATLLVVVSTVSISLLGIHLLDAMEVHTSYAYFMAGSFWVVGYILYLLIITILTYRLFFRRFKPGDWDAPYWICMGAAAIIVLAGSELVMRMPTLPGWEDIRQTVLWMTGVAWSMGTLWTPYLLVMDIRKFTRVGITASAPMWIKTLPWSRLAFGRQYHAYDPPSWSRVFPMGMYAACTLSLAKATSFGSLAIIPQYWGWFALLVWSLTLIGMLRFVINMVMISPH
ncbi:tellurite resistance/C4-dicarboxylate transporter family protein [Nitrosomonas sp. Nm132]|uniref:tellurite resistance/C4-dicarboxylate transporter family protein n=1 Tax=Nitrosomonas sp. Nm132 TaxID=1881053 RepID=UPI00088FF5BF|nr:tellurite resistance/C4-dicarboxylate transporter family protein [Nitrosomonas sp. Nm132]SDG83180.1 Tellurite resistance protein TehA [Nitrosomonas sp. Nm132]